MKASAKSGRAALNVSAAPQSDGLGDVRHRPLDDRRERLPED